MKKFLSKFKLPFFMSNNKFKLVGFIALIVVIGELIVSFMFNIGLGLFFTVLSLVLLFYFFQSTKQINKDTSEYVSNLFKRVDKNRQLALSNMPFGILIYDNQGQIKWLNKYFNNYLRQTSKKSSKRVIGKNLKLISKSLFNAIKDDNKSNNFTSRIDGKTFKLSVQRKINTVYLTDISNYEKAKRQFAKNKLAIGEVFLDNFSEITKSMNDNEISNLEHYVTNSLNHWVNKYGGYLRRIGSDRYLILLNYQTLQKMENDKFRVLDTIRDHTSKRNFPVTLSMGIAYNDDDFTELTDQAQENLNVALGRGGDQVVVKANNEKARFYGGKTNPMEKRTRVKARLISQSLQKLMQNSDEIFIKGHSKMDTDALGAALGIRRIAQMNGKKAWIVLDKEDNHSDVNSLLTKAKSYPNLADSFISSEEAVKRATDQSLYVMVDHSNPALSKSAERLYKKLENRIAIIDHHRRGENFPENPLLVYIEPYASSSSELITELFEYQSQEGDSINKLEATALLGGIIVDTHSFFIRSGTRTFEAASYLRSAGASPDDIKGLLKENVDDYLNRNHLISRVEFINNDTALIVGEDDQSYDSVTSAQAADSLLEIKGINASFVVTHRSDSKDNAIGISARSNGKVNVQTLMEKMGGGGHLTSSATVIDNKPIKEVKKALLSNINTTVE